jgi:hypothetical protein
VDSVEVERLPGPDNGTGTCARALRGDCAHAQWHWKAENQGQHFRWESLVGSPQVGFEGMPGPVSKAWPRIYALTQQRAGMTVEVPTKGKCQEFQRMAKEYVGGREDSELSEDGS